MAHSVKCYLEGGDNKDWIMLLRSSTVVIAGDTGKNNFGKGGLKPNCRRKRNKKEVSINSKQGAYLVNLAINDKWEE